MRGRNKKPSASPSPAPLVHKDPRQPFHLLLLFLAVFSVGAVVDSRSQLFLIRT